MILKKFLFNKEQMTIKMYIHKINLILKSQK
jgi:hypothetical protein